MLDTFRRRLGTALFSQRRQALVAGLSRRAAVLAPQHERRLRLSADAAATFRTVRGGLGALAVDALTELPTRAHLPALARALARESPAAGFELCVLCLDLDDFRAFNDRHGRAAGDRVLRSTAGRLVTAARADDLVLRLGGDEFAVLAPCAAGRGGALIELIAARIFAQIQSVPDSFALGGCIGTARWRPGGPALPETLAQAGEALMAAKRAGRRQLRHYAPRRPRRVLTSEQAA